MPKGTNQKFKLYYLAKIMVEKTDEDHYITMPEIIKALAKYDVSAERKSIYKDLEDLEHLGIEVEGEPVGKGFHYHVVNHQFELPELKLLVDAIQSSKFITAKKSNDLIKKLEGFVSEYEAKQLHRQVYVGNRIKTMNESIYYNVDAIHNAIAEDKKIRFQYFQWNVKKEMELRHGGAYYHISLSEDKREGKDSFKKLDMAMYAKKSFGMFGGAEEKVKLLMHNNLTGVIVDRFGKDIMMFPADEEHFIAHVDVQVSDQFISWVFALGAGAKIIGPEAVLERVKVYIKRLHDQYGV